MAGDGGLNALSLLPENVLPQWQQKIALRAEKGSMPCLYCRKMCCLNGSRKLHFVQKIHPDTQT